MKDGKHSLNRVEKEIPDPTVPRFKEVMEAALADVLVSDTHAPIIERVLPGAEKPVSKDACRERILEELEATGGDRDEVVSRLVDSLNRVGQQEIKTVGLLVDLIAIEHALSPLPPRDEWVICEMTHQTGVRIAQSLRRRSRGPATEAGDLGALQNTIDFVLLRRLGRRDG